MTQRDLVARASRRDWPEFDALFRQTVHPVHRFLYGLTGDRVRAELLTVRTFEAAWQQGVPSLSHMPFVAWMLRLALQIANREGTDRGGAPQGWPEGVDPEGWRAFRALDREARVALLLRVGERLAPGNVAQVMGRDASAVRKAVYRGVAAAAGVPATGLLDQQWDVFERLLETALRNEDNAPDGPISEGTRAVGRMCLVLRADPTFVLRTKVKLATTAKAEAAGRKNTSGSERRRNNRRGPSFLEVRKPAREASERGGRNGFLTQGPRVSN
jgi:DNA-directed RNA polymerase specialized sigma24 family protein